MTFHCGIPPKAHLNSAKNVIHESLALSKQNNMTYDMTVLGMRAWLTKNLCSYSWKSKSLLFLDSSKDYVNLFITPRRPNKKMVAMEIKTNPKKIHHFEKAAAQQGRAGKKG